MTVPLPDNFKELVAGVLDVEPDTITPDLAFGELEAWDSFGHLQIVLALEGEFGVQLDPNRIPDLTTMDLLRKELEARGVALD